ncbi:MAG: aminotransferase class V-fold PLP-dependent enzyme [Halodesulfurarchaeum sp.]
MTPEELRATIPGIRETVYLNTGASGPSPRTVVESVESALERQEYDAPGSEGMYPNARTVFEETRETVADFLGADPDSIALTESTTDGINRIATALEWGPGDTVVISDLEHSAGQLPWKRLRETTGIDVEIVESDTGRFDLEAYEAALDGASLLCVSSLDWLYGRTHPVEELVAIAKEAGARTLVDAVQSVGQQPVDVTEWDADFVAAAGHKWLLGPWGAGFLYVNESVLPALSPSHVGYRSVKNPNSREYEWQDSARRFEIGTTNPAIYAGLRSAIETVHSIGIETIRDRIEALTSTFKAGVPDEQLSSPNEFHSGLVTVRVSNPEATVERLASDDIVIRALPLSESIRISLHAFNTDGDVRRVLDALEPDWK